MRADAHAAIDLICLPHAGGNAQLYRQWPQHLPADVRVRAIDLPGHGAERGFPPLTRWPDVIDTLAARVITNLRANVPFAVMGHSMGALTGIETIREIKRRTGRQALWFGVSACVAPSRRALETHWLDCTHDAMVAQLRKLGGTPDALLVEREFIDFMLPVLRADFHLCGTYAQFTTQREPLSCPVDVFIGQDDTATSADEDVDAWSDETHGACTVHRFEGGHFFIDDQRDAVLRIVDTSLADALAASLERELWTH